MSTLAVFHLIPKPGSGFHFGEQGLELETSRVTFPSDSLMAALIATVAEQEGNTAVDKFVHPFLNDQPPFLLTSVWPRIADVLLFPRPRLPLHHRARVAMAGQAPTGDVPPLDRKFSRKTQFVSTDILHRVVQAQDMTDYLPHAPHGRFRQGGAVWLTATEESRLTLRDDTLWHTDPVARVTLDRQTNAGVPYMMGRTRFAETCGLWVGVQSASEAALQRVETLLHHLGDRGLGGERATGYGGFTLRRAASLTLPSPAEPNAHLLLSRFHPHAAAETAVLRDPVANYQLVEVGGWLYAPQTPSLRRRKVTMVTAGSVLGGDVRGTMVNAAPAPTTRQNKAGQWVKLSVAHPVYRSGLALTLPVLARPTEDVV